MLALGGEKKKRWETLILVITGIAVITKQIFYKVNRWVLHHSPVQ